MEYKGLDEIDDLIIKHLVDNARMSHVEIAKKTNLSRLSVRKRIKDLEESGIIEKYTIVVNPQKLGKTVSVFFDIEVDPLKIDSVAQDLSEIPSITDVYLMTGNSSLHVHALMYLNEHLSDFLRDEVSMIDGIKSIKSQLILSRFKTRNAMKL